MPFDKNKETLVTEQHKLLTIDGGGIRGVLSVEVLAEMERQLAEAEGIPVEEYKLGDYFDYVAGTSTGAVIAAGIAIGMSARELLDFYVNTGPLMFDQRKLAQMASWAVNKTKYDATPLALELQKTFGAETAIFRRNPKTRRHRQLLRRRPLGGREQCAGKCALILHRATVFNAA